MADISLGCSGRDERHDAAYEWKFRKDGFSIGTTSIVGGPSIGEIEYYMSKGVVSLADLEILGFKRVR